MLAVGDALRASHVGAVYVSYGTFAGVDALGILGEVGRLYPAARDTLGRLSRMVVDAVAGDAGNYTAQYLQIFEQAINRPDARHVPVRMCNWSSENHHLGRADGAVRLLDELVTAELPSGQRVLLWGHSHAGNVFALLTNLLGGDAAANAKFFEAARIYYRWPITGWVDIPVWRRVETLLQREPYPLARHPLDVVTFGSPIRYGWDPRGYARLLHMVNHRPSPDLPPYRAAFPSSLTEVLEAVGGDYIQQLGIAGTNTMPGFFSWRAWLADHRLNEFLQPGISALGLLDRMRLGMRVHERGTTLLVDYGPAKGSVVEHIAGHAIYTRPEWMLFHAEQVVRQMYTPRE
jgi:hypothetical protein